MDSLLFEAVIGEPDPEPVRFKVVFPRPLALSR
jgi:hypothetical protein